ncbi:LamG-like jellyroll fold domain-containing protein [Allorhodopirellula heiligendammensis]|uniref:FecR protein n=1 Tax=Allorhodopirellula heiligendammensis TaxID=2714739 RepID=A0A5C6C4B3_9BACT|nr:LamG-like jellyroll fold domain-containing protein [Allorhodopirellula heiligendammensis]TWU19018.1 FecR protein [Allorhodopirellula heiligendammensis]
MNREERLLLIDSLLDGSIDEANLLRIEAELSVDPQVRQEYYRRLQLDILLKREAESGSSVTAEVVETFNRLPMESKRVPSSAPGKLVKILAGSLVAIAATMLLVVSVNRAIVPSGGDVRGDSIATSREPSASGFAVLGGLEDAIWAGAPIAVGDLLPTGELHLKSGRVHIELFSGVQLVLEGDSIFSIDSPMQVTMASGSARARVPEPAQGFRIKTSSGDVVDLGTEFSVDVDDSGADVHVVDGEVELHPHRSDSLRIEAGVSRRLVGTGGIANASTATSVAIGPSEFDDLRQQQQKQRLAHWTAARAAMAMDPRAVAHFQFTSGVSNSRQVENLARGASRPASDGTTVVASRTLDRWGRHDAALDFSRVGSRVRVNVPGEHRGLTLMCWVKINSLDRWYNSLFLTDGHDDREPHWQLMDDGRIFFSVKVPASIAGEHKSGAMAQQVFYSPQVWDASWSGRWVMLAVTYDVDQARVTHYVNGEAISSESIPEDMLVDSIRIGPASICNWSDPKYQTDPQFVLRNLNGSMDEFALYSGALPADEILQWYRDGDSGEL